MGITDYHAKAQVWAVTPRFRSFHPNSIPATHGSNMDQNSISEFELKMQDAGLSDACVAAFRHNYAALVAGDTGEIPESSIQPVETLPHYSELGESSGDTALLAQTAILKLNGGLGTSSDRTNKSRTACGAHVSDGGSRIRRGRMLTNCQRISGVGALQDQIAH